MLVVIGLLYPWSDLIWPWIRTAALLLFLFAALTDWLDGWLARKFGQVSEFGKFMDALSDKVLTLGMFVSLLALKVIDLWALFPDSTYSFKGIPHHRSTIGCGRERQDAGRRKNWEIEDGHSTYLHLPLPRKNRS